VLKADFLHQARMLNSSVILIRLLDVTRSENYETDFASTIATTASGVSLIALSFRRGLVREQYGEWSRLLV
jgi:hypothetical protein